MSRHPSAAAADDDEARFGHRIKVARDARGWTQHRLAVEVERVSGGRVTMSGSEVSRLETGGVRNPRWDKVEALAEALEIDLTPAVGEGDAPPGALADVSRKLDVLLAVHGVPDVDDLPGRTALDDLAALAEAVARISDVLQRRELLFQDFADRLRAIEDAVRPPKKSSRAGGAA